MMEGEGTMNAEGRRFLSDACGGAQKWADQFETLDEAWDVCANAEWLLWAVQKVRRMGLGQGVRFIPRHWSAEEIHTYVENPFERRSLARCLYCAPPRWLTNNELRESNLCGTIPRRPEHLALIAPELVTITTATNSFTINAQ